MPPKPTYDELAQRVKELKHETIELNGVINEIDDSRDYLENLFNYANAPIIVWNPDSSITRFNHAFEHLTGYTADEVFGKKLNILFPQASRDESLSKIAHTLDGEYWESVEIPILHKNGDVRIVLWNSANIVAEDGATVVATIAHGQDVTERKHSEQTLQKSRDILQAVIDGISDPLIMLNKDFSVKVLNKAAMKYNLASDFKKVIGKPCFEGLRGKTNPCEGCEIPSAIQSRQEKAFERKGFMEPEKIEQVVIYPSHQKDYQEGTAIIRISDVTRAKQMERELIQADKMISLGVLVSGVAHEINNPNNFIMLNGPLLREAWESIVPVLEKYYEENGDFSMGGLPYSEMRDEVPKLFSGIKEGSERIQRIVQDLKDFARQDGANMDQSVNINEAIKSSIRLTDNLIKKATKNFRIKYGRNLPLIRGNKQKLEQIMINLIQNACQALPDKEKGIYVTSSLDKEGDGVVVEVLDEGEGIPENLLPRIMDPFFTTKRSEGGTGLGMSVSSNIVKGHGGKIKVKSELGKGTAIRFFIPTTRIEKPVKILVTDDDSAVRKFLTAALGKLGIYSVREASNGAEAFLKIGQEPPDLLILDVQMPDMDGAEVCRLIKEKPELSAIKVIIITGFAKSSQMKEIARMGFEKILTKPFSMPTLLNMMDEVLEVKK